MIEKIVLDYLAAQLDVPVFMQEPESNPNPGTGQFVVIEKTGSGRRDWICNATIAIQSYAPTLYEAAVLNEQIKQAMDGILVIPQISKVSLNSDYNFTNEEMKQPRYQAVFDLVHYMD